MPILLSQNATLLCLRHFTVPPCCIRNATGQTAHYNFNVIAVFSDRIVVIKTIYVIIINLLFTKTNKCTL